MKPDTVDKLYFVLVLLVTGRALWTRFKAMVGSEGAAAWRAMHEQWKPRTGMLLSILGYRFAGDAQATIEAVEYA